MAYGARIKLRLFIEGVEVPCVAAQIQAVANSPMVASIQIPPLGEGLKLPPRCCVHLFFYDADSDFEAEAPHRTGAYSAGRRGPTPTEQAAFTEQDAVLANYKLLFAGEVMGFTWSKNPSQRSLVLQCADFSNYWDYAYQFKNTDLFGPGYKAMFSGGATNLFTDLLMEPGMIVVQIIKTPPTRYPAMKGLGGGLIHLIESIGGSYWYDKKYAGQNIFFSLAELRLRITQMVMAYEKDQTSSKLLGGSYDGLFGRSIGNLGEQASIRKCLTALSSVIFHEMYPQPCPYYRPGTQGTVSGSKRERINEMQVFGPLAARAEALANGVATLIGTLDLLVGSETTERAKVREVMLSGAKDAGVLRHACITLDRKVTAEIPNAKRVKLTGTASMAGAFSAKLKEAGLLLGKAQAQLRVAQATLVQSIADTLREALKKLSEVSTLEADVTRTDRQVPAILGQQIFRPDVWFSAPPRCNVVFPEQYTTLQFRRAFMEEPTRLLLKTNNEFFGEDMLFDNFYFAPKSITLKGEANTLQSILRNDILDHELFTGILPVFEKMGEFNIFAARSGMVDGRTPKIGLAQRSCNFLYFKHRFGPRQLMVQGRFMPNIAVGFPGLVLDQYVDIESIKNYNRMIQCLPPEYRSAVRGIDKMLGTHFLASFSQITHNVEASGQGITAIGCSYARLPDESVEFLGVRQDEVRGKVRRQGVVERETEVAAIAPPRLNATGPAWGRIIKVEEVTDKYYCAGDLNHSQKLPVFAGSGGLELPTADKKKGQAVNVAVGVFAKAKEYGEQIAVFVGDPDVVVQFRAYKVTEEVNRDHQEKKIDLPPEEYIRPGWYGDCWHPAKISEVYYDMLGTGAITEAQQFNAAGSTTAAGVYSSDAKSDVADAIANENYTNIEANTPLNLALAQGATIEDAVAYLAYTYSLIKQGSYDIDEFIRAYTWRPIATLVDMFGSPDLLFSADGSRVVQGIEGFHSRAFGPYEDLFGLVTQDIESVVGIQRGSAQAAKADKRMAKRDAVLQYTARLRLSRGILG